MTAMDKGKQDLLLGIVFFLGLGLLLYATAQLTDLSLTKPAEMEVHFQKADGLREGDPVFVLGHRIGNVSEITYNPESPTPESRIKMVIELTRELTLKQDATIKILDANLLGGKMIDIDPGTDASLWPSNSPFLGIVKPNGINALGELLDDPEIKVQFKEIVTGVRDFVVKLNGSDNTIGKLFTESTLYEDFSATIASVRKSVEEVQKGEGALGRVIYDKKTGDDLAAGLTSFRSVADKVDKGDGLIGRLVNSTKIADDVASAADNINGITTDLQAGKGTFGRLLKDDELADTVTKTVDAFYDFAKKAGDPEAGLVGALIGDPKLREQGSKFIGDLAAISEDLRTGNGLLARLINDEEMGHQFNRILNQISRAIEDAREAAPVGTFFSVFSGAF